MRPINLDEWKNEYFDKEFLSISCSRSIYNGGLLCLRYNRFDQEDAFIQDLKAKHRDSFGSSRFGDESSFDSPSSRKTTKTSSNYEEQQSPYYEERRKQRADHDKGYRSDGGRGNSYYSDEQGYDDGDYNNGRSREQRSEKKHSSSRYQSGMEQRVGGSSTQKVTDSYNDRDPSPVDDSQWRSGHVDYYKDYDNQGAKNVSSSSNVDRGSRTRHSKDLERSSEYNESMRTITNSREEERQQREQEVEEEEMEDDIEMEFRRNAAAAMMENENSEPVEEEDEDIDDWLLAQSKKYGVKYVN